MDNDCLWGTLCYAKYFINGFREDKNYFLNLGKFIEEEINALFSGQTIIKGNNTFWIERGDKNV